MKKTFFIVSLMMVTVFQSHAQKYLTKNGFIRFYSDAPIEKIEANNRQVNAVLDASTGDFVFRVLMKSFVFEKALMQEHFNENYVESDQYPNSTFIGKINNLKEINLSKEGIYPATVQGKLTIHNVTHDITVAGTVEVKKDALAAKAKFTVAVGDYNISIPNTLVNNISKTIEITVDVFLDKLNQ